MGFGIVLVFQVFWLLFGGLCAAVKSCGVWHFLKMLGFSAGAGAGFLFPVQAGPVTLLFKFPVGRVEGVVLYLVSVGLSIEDMRMVHFVQGFALK